VLADKENVRPIDSVGQVFDPYRHVAVETVFDPSRPTGTIVEERRRGVPIERALGIALDATGFVSEGSGENIFLVKKSTLYTPPLTASVLPGITRSAIMQLAQELKIPVVERSIPREMLYIADEVFFVGTATEVTPVRSIDRVTIGDGSRGAITGRLQAEFNALANGQKDDRHRWVTAL